MKTVYFKNLFVATLLVFVTSHFSTLMAQSRNDKNREKREVRYDKEGPSEKKTKEMPCMMYDNDEEYVATGMMRIKMGGEGEKNMTLQFNKLLGSCQQQLKMKVKGRYQAVIHDYFEQMDMDAKSSAASRITSAGEMIIDQLLDDTREDCREIGEVDDAGFANIYMGILIKKTTLVEKLADGMQESNLLSSEEKEKLRQNESKFRESAFKVFDRDMKEQ